VGPDRPLLDVDLRNSLNAAVAGLDVHSLSVCRRV